MSVRRFDFEDVARRVYDSFLLQQPAVPVEGLFRRAGDFFIVAKNLDAPTDAGDESESVAHWFGHALKPLGMPIYLVPERPADAEEVRGRNLDGVQDGSGVGLRIVDVRRALALFLPPTFPTANVDVDDDERVLVIAVTRPLEPEEARVLDDVVQRIGQPLEHRIVVRDQLVVVPEEEVLVIPAARALHPTVPVGVRRFVEADEDFWRDNFRRVLRGDVPVDEILAPDKRRSCLVGTTFPPANLRSYLSLYDRVFIGMPLQQSLAERVSDFGISTKEVVELCRLGHVRFVAPQGVQRYDQAFMASLLEAAPESIVGSRRLGAAAHASALSRNPLFMLPATADQRRVVLRALLRGADGDAKATKFTRAVARGLSKAWPSYEWLLHLRGAMTSLNGPLASVSIEFIRELTGKDFFIELGAVAQYVEWAAALGAHYAPFETDGYSEVGHGEVLVALHTGVGLGATRLAAPAQFEVAKELLVIDNDVDVFDFVRELGRGDLHRFRGLVTGLARPGRTKEERDELITMWNSQVRAYERRPDRVKTMGLAGFALSAVANAVGHPDILSVSGLLLPGLLTYLQEDATAASREVGTLLDAMNARLAGVTTEAVLLARMKRRVKGMKT